MQVVDLVCAHILRRIVCKQCFFRLILASIFGTRLLSLGFGISPIATSSLRYKTRACIDTVCPLCRVSVGSEVHFTLCSALNYLRQRLIPDTF